MAAECLAAVLAGKSTMSLSVLSDSRSRQRWIAHAGGLAALVGVAFLAWVVALQFLRTDLSWSGAQLSRYLHGPYGLALRVAYCTLAISMVPLAAALQASQAPALRSNTVFGLFCVAAAGLAGVAIGDSYLPERAPDIALPVHLFAAQTAFLCVIAAILLQSWRFRVDPRWRRHARLAGRLGALAFVVLFAHAVLRLGPRGLGQKSAIALIVAWMVLVGVILARGLDTGAAPDGRSRDNGVDSNHGET